MAQTPEAVAREWFETVWNDLDESAIDRLMHPQAIAHGLGPQPIRGSGQFKAFHHDFKSAFSNIQIQIDRAVAQGDVVAVLCHVTANHAGDAFGPATRRDVDFLGHDVHPSRGRPDCRRLEYIRLPDDVSADGMGVESGAPAS